MDLLNCDGVQESLHHAESAREPPGCVDEVELAQSFWVVVLGDGGCLLDVIVHRADFRNANAFQIHDRTARFEERSRFARTGRETWVSQFFVFDNQVLQHAFGGCDLIHRGKIDLAQLFDVYRSPILAVYQHDIIRRKFGKTFLTLSVLW